MSDSQRSKLIQMVSSAGDRYGYGPDGLISLMDETKHSNTQEVTDEQLEEFCKRHGIESYSREGQTA